MDTPQQSNRNIPSPPPSDASSIAPKERSWSFDLLIDAYEELAFQAHHFWENSFQNKTSMIEKIGSFLEMPFIICRVLTIPLPVEDHYCRPVVALSTAGSPFWLLYYREKEFWTVSATAFILVALVIALAILRYADDNKMPLVTCIPLSLYGFLIAATWIDSIGGALVDLLQFFGTFLRIPPGILGMTVLAVGNSMGDLSSNLQSKSLMKSNVILGNLLKSELAKIPMVIEVRGSGLLLGIVLKSPNAKTLAAELLINGVLVNAPSDDVIRIAPAFIITKRNILDFVAAFRKTLESLNG